MSLSDSRPLPALATAHTARRFPVIDIDDDLDQLLASVDIPESSQTFSINSSQSVTESKNAVWEEKGRVKLLRERLHTKEEEIRNLRDKLNKLSREHVQELKRSKERSEKEVSRLKSQLSFQEKTLTDDILQLKRQLKKSEEDRSQLQQQLRNQPQQQHQQHCYHQQVTPSRDVPPANHSVSHALHQKFAVQEGPRNLSTIASKSDFIKQDKSFPLTLTHNSQQFLSNNDYVFLQMSKHFAIIFTKLSQLKKPLKVPDSVTGEEFASKLQASFRAISAGLVPCYTLLPALELLILHSAHHSMLENALYILRLMLLNFDAATPKLTAFAASSPKHRNADVHEFGLFQRHPSIHNPNILIPSSCEVPRISKPVVPLNLSEQKTLSESPIFAHLLEHLKEFGRFEELLEVVLDIFEALFWSCPRQLVHVIFSPLLQGDNIQEILYHKHSQKAKLTFIHLISLLYQVCGVAKLGSKPLIHMSNLLTISRGTSSISQLRELRFRIIRLWLQVIDASGGDFMSVVGEAVTAHQLIERLLLLLDNELGSDASSVPQDLVAEALKCLLSMMHSEQELSWHTNSVCFSILVRLQALPGSSVFQEDVGYLEQLIQRQL